MVDLNLIMVILHILVAAMSGEYFHVQYKRHLPGKLPPMVLIEYLIVLAANAVMASFFLWRYLNA